MPSVKGIATAACAALVMGVLAIGAGNGTAPSSAPTPSSAPSIIAEASANAGPSSSSASSSASTQATTNSTLPEGSTFSITFLDVGQGDAAVVSCDGHYMIVDGGTPDASRLMYSYCANNGIEQVDYVVATHPDTDHTGGIAGALQVASVGRAFCTQTSGTTRAFESMARYLGKQDVAIEVPETGDSFSLGSASVEVVGTGVGAGNDSIMLRIVYGATSFLLAGDAPEDEERAVVNSGVDIESTLLKVAHHGSASSTCYRFLREVNPQIAIISVGKNNNYGHPTEEVLSRLTDCGSEIYRTDMQGDIIARSDGSTVTVEVERNPDVNTGQSRAETQEQELEGIAYIGNRNSRKFHLPTCKSLPKEENRVILDSREEAIDAGYTPCGNCNP